MSNSGILEILGRQAWERSRDLPAEAFRIRGLWRTELFFQPNPDERIFAYTYVLAQTEGQGCCYCEPEVKLDPRWMGQDARAVQEVADVPLALRIALLDAIYASFPQQPALSFVLNGTSGEKTLARTQLVVEETLRLLRPQSLAEAKVVNVGVVGNFLKELRAAGVGEVWASDMDCCLIGKELHGVAVAGGEETLRLVAASDLALVTGMTMATSTLDDILQVAKENGTKLVIFAETGAHLGPTLCELGVDVVVSEPFPFYIFQGASEVKIYRRAGV